MAPSSPVIEVRLVVARQLERLAAPGSAREAAAGAIRDSAELVLEAIGVPATPEVAIDVGGPATGPDAWGRLYVGGERCRFSAEAGRAARAVVLLEHDSGLEASELVPWLETSLDDEGGGQAAAFLAALLPGVLGEHGAALISDDIGAMYAASIGVEDNLPSLAAVLRQLAGLRVSVADRDAVRRGLENGAGEPGEALLAELRPPVVELRLSLAFLESLTTEDPNATAGLLTYLRDGLFVELGVEIPPVRLVPARMPDRTFALTINDVALAPRLGLRADECLVNEEPRRLAAFLTEASDSNTVRGWMQNPGSGMANARVDIAAAQAMGDVGLIVWTPLGHLILAVAADLRAHASCFVDAAGARALLDSLEPIAPTLVRQTRSRVSEARLARSLRALAAEQESGRNLSAVLEELLDSEGHDADVRRALAPAIATRHARGTRTLVVYLLDPAIERALSEARPLAEGVADDILAAIQAELAMLPLAVTPPTLLTDAAVRARLKAVVQDELPWLDVLCYDDLPRALNVQPVARIALQADVLTGASR